MRIKKFAWLVLPVLLSLGVILTAGCGTATETQSHVVTDVTAQRAYGLTQENQNNPNFIILDVRTPQEFTEGHVARAINLDFYSPTFRTELNALDKSKTYLVYCRSGNRSQQTIDMMKELGFKKIYHMTGGIIEWEGEELPTVKESSSTFPPYRRKSVSRI